jgi:UDP-MurNAc hydroxylase
MSHDAAVLVVVEDRALLHVNDARISLAQVRRAAAEAGRPIDVMAVQMSGASWHPVSYEYDEATREAVSETKRVGKFRAVTRLVRSVQPRLVLPYAGPPCFLDDELFEHNSRLHGSGVFPDQHEALAWLRDKLPHQHGDYLLPGDAVELDELRIARDPHWADFRMDATPAERRAYLEEYAERRRPFLEDLRASYPEPAADAQLAERFRAHFEALGSLSTYFLARIGMVLRFEVLGPAGGTWDAHIGPDDVRVDLDGGDCHADYRLRLDARWLAPVIEGRVRWEELLLSLRFSARRDPDHYNDYLVGLLKHADLAALRAVEEFETHRDPDDTVDIERGGEHLRVSRFCPHAGEELAETAIVVDGRLRCLGHNFEFDLETGECVNARCDPISVQRLDPAKVG